MPLYVCIPLFHGLEQLRPFFWSNQLQTCSGLLYNYQDRIVSAYMSCVIEHLSKSQGRLVFHCSIRILSILFASYFWFLLYSAPSEVLTALFFHRTTPSKLFNLGINFFSFTRNQVCMYVCMPVISSYLGAPCPTPRGDRTGTNEPHYRSGEGGSEAFTVGINVTKLKQRNRERTSVNMDIRSRTMVDIWSEKNAGFIGPIKFLSYFPSDRHTSRSLLLAGVYCSSAIL